MTLAARLKIAEKAVVELTMAWAFGPCDGQIGDANKSKALDACSVLFKLRREKKGAKRK